MITGSGRPKPDTVIQIGDKEVLFTTTFQVPDGQVATITTGLLSTADLKLKFVFNPPDSERPDEMSKGAVGDWALDVDGIPKFRFFGWRAFGGRNLATPLHIGELFGRKMFVQLWHSWMPRTNSNLVHLEVMLEAAK